MPNDVFVKRRLRQLVREELARTDVKKVVREVVGEFFHAQVDQRISIADQQRLPALKERR